MGTSKYLYNLLPIVVFAAIPVTLLWFCWRLYKFYKSTITTKHNDSVTGSSGGTIHKVEMGFVRPTYQDDLVSDKETSGWLDYTCAASGSPGVPPKHRDCP